MIRNGFCTTGFRPTFDESRMLCLAHAQLNLELDGWKGQS